MYCLAGGLFYVVCISSTVPISYLASTQSRPLVTYSPFGRRRAVEACPRLPLCLCQPSSAALVRLPGLCRPDLRVSLFPTSASRRCFGVMTPWLSKRSSISFSPFCRPCSRSFLRVCGISSMALHSSGCSYSPPPRRGKWTGDSSPLIRWLPRPPVVAWAL